MLCRNKRIKGVGKRREVCDLRSDKLLRSLSRFLLRSQRKKLRKISLLRPFICRIIDRTQANQRVSSAEINSTGPPLGEVSQVVEHLFRHEAGKLVSTLTRIFGVEHLNLAEDVVQEALARALQTWPYYGIPKNPSAWIMQVSRNLALDVVRRERVFRNKEIEIVHLMEQQSPAPNEAVFLDQELKDDRLRMMFACCHPLIAPEAQVALALKTLCGFSTAEIAKAFLTSEAGVAKRLTGAKKKKQLARGPL